MIIESLCECGPQFFKFPRDGHASLSYDIASNRITTTGFAYDAAGNHVRALIPVAQDRNVTNTTRRTGWSS